MTHLRAGAFDSLSERAVLILSALMHALVLQPAPHIRLGDNPRPWVAMVAARTVETLVMLVLPVVVTPRAGGPLMGEGRAVHGVCDASAGETSAANGCIAPGLYWCVFAMALLTHGVLAPILTHTAALNRRLTRADCRDSCRCVSSLRLRWQWPTREVAARKGDANEAPVTTMANPVAHIRTSQQSSRT